jgi:tripartite ATP-independent transporter DctP family solute receptor
MKRKRLLASVVVLAMIVTAFTGCGGGSGGSGSSGGSTGGDAPGGDDPIKVKIGHTDTSTRSTHTWAVWLGEYLEEKAPGKFIIEVYPDGQLGDTPDLVAGVKLGTLTMCFDLSSVLSTAIGPKASCIDLPYLYPSYESWIKGTFENGGLELFNEAAKEAGYYCIDMYYNGIRQVISSKKNYHNANDLKGQKIRIAQNDLNIAMWDAMGANPTPMAWGEVITSLSLGQIDALDHSLGVFNDFNLHEIAPYVTLTNHASSPFPVFVSLEWIEGLPADLRVIFEEGVHLMCEQQRAEERGLEVGYIERFKAEGATVEELTQAEVSALIEAVQPVYDEWRNKVGSELIDKWLAPVPKEGSE